MMLLPPGGDASASQGPIHKLDLREERQSGAKSHILRQITIVGLKPEFTDPKSGVCNTTSPKMLLLLLNKHITVMEA